MDILEVLKEYPNLSMDTYNFLFMPQFLGIISNEMRTSLKYNIIFSQNHTLMLCNLSS